MKMHRFLLAVSLATAATWPALAQSESGSRVAACAKIDEDAGRLACYDMAAGRTALTPNPSPAGVGKWRSSTTNDPLTDKPTVFLSLRAESGAGRHDKLPLLAIRCKNNTTELWIDWETYVHNEGRSVTTRIGNKPAAQSYWSVSTDHTATFSPATIPLIKSMLSEQRLVALVTPFSQSPITTVFDITGIAEAMKPVQKACNWS
jgi:type VI secretion system protein VasI